MIGFVLPYRYLEGFEGRLLRTVKALAADCMLCDYSLIVSDQTPYLTPYDPRDAEAIEEMKAVRDNLAVKYHHLSSDTWNRAKAINDGIRLAKMEGREWVCVMSLDLDCRDLPFKMYRTLEFYQFLEHYYVFDVRQGEQPHFADNWGGDIAMFAISLWEEVGGFDERFTGYGYEDKDFYMRVQAYAFQPPGIVIRHLPHPQCPTIHEDLERNRALFERKWNYA